jgi:hypothetical protein
LCSVLNGGCQVAENKQFRNAVRGFYAWLLSMVLVVLASFTADSLVQGSASASRVAGVLIGTLGWVPIIIVTAQIIRNGDEFVRRIHLVAISIAFAGTLLMITLLDWLTRAHFVAPPRLSILWLMIAILWWLSLAGVKRYFERHS